MEALHDWLYGRQEDIKRAPMYAKTEFFCLSCHRDFEGTGVKQVRVPKGSVWFAYYVGICVCGKHAIRRITDKLSDPYFYQSKTIRAQQSRYADAMLSPHHPRFKQFYPQQYSRLFLQEKGIIL